VRDSISRPLDYFENNLGATLVLLAAMARYGIDRLVFSSTCAIFGEHGRPTVAEDCEPAPASPYATSKLMVEQLLQSLAHGGLRSVSLRYFNAAGADAEGEIGQRHELATHLIPLAINAGCGGEPLQIFGTDFPTPDGTAVRDYVHVADLACAHVKALDYLALHNGSEFFNLGSGRGYSVREVVEAVVRLGVPVRYSIAPARAGDVACLVAECGKARRLLGWTPRYVTLESIIQSAIAWHRKSAECAREAAAVSAAGII
jgi:UDP-glucose 4-epimerase